MNLKFSDAQGKQENQIKAVRGFIAQGVDAIILAPVVETGWEPVLREAKQAKIPVMLVDRGVKVEDESLYTTLIASDFVAEGQNGRRLAREERRAARRTSSSCRARPARRRRSIARRVSRKRSRRIRR